MTEEKCPLCGSVELSKREKIDVYKLVIERMGAFVLPENDKEKNCKIVITRPKLLIDMNCPKCGSSPIKTVIIKEIVCDKCGLKFVPDLKPNVFSFYSSIIGRGLEYNNKLVISAKKSFKNELEAIAKSYRNFQNWEVDGPFEAVDYSRKRKCLICGFCNSCVTCECGNSFVPKRRNDTCQKCNKKGRYRQTYIKKFKKEGECPYCGSKDISRTVVKPIEIREDLEG